MLNKSRKRVKQTFIFFRNDDIRSHLDSSLFAITDIFIKHRIPISLAIEPGNVTQEVIDWLLRLKSGYSELFDLIQHGYMHKLNFTIKKNHKIKKGEFGGERNFNEQYQDIITGKNLMSDYFGESWLEIFTFPYGGKNIHSLLALDKCHYKAFNGHRGHSYRHRLFYKIGHVLRKNYLFSNIVSYHLRNRPGTKLFEIDVDIDPILKYIDETNKCEMMTIEELKRATLRLEFPATIGVVLHHRYFNTSNKIKLIEDYIMWCKSIPEFNFISQSKLYEKYHML